MSAPGVTSTPERPASDPAPPSGERRIRHDVRDGLTVAALSLGTSLAITAACWLLVAWWA